MKSEKCEVFESLFSFLNSKIQCSLKGQAIASACLLGLVAYYVLLECTMRNNLNKRTSEKENLEIIFQSFF